MGEAILSGFCLLGWESQSTPNLQTSFIKAALFKRTLEQAIIIFNNIIFHYRHNSSSRQSTDWAR